MHIDFTKTEACRRIKDFIKKIDLSIKEKKQHTSRGELPYFSEILSKLNEIVDGTPLSNKKGRYANPGMADVIEKIEKITKNPYLINSFGNKVRMDFGTGHELNFLCFIYSILEENKTSILKSETCQSVSQKIQQGLSYELSNLSSSNQTNTKVKGVDLTTLSEVNDINSKIEGFDYTLDTQSTSFPTHFSEIKNNAGNLDLITSCTLSLNTDSSEYETSSIITLDSSSSLDLNQNLSQQHPILDEFSISPIDHISIRFEDAWLYLIEYSKIIRKFVKKFNVEAAGSRGVWSIDDYLLFPFVFGSSENFFLEQSIDEIIDGIFKYEYDQSNSPLLKSICKSPWPSINSVLLKRYDLDVLSRSVVTQHFIYTQVLPLELSQVDD